MYLTKCGAVFPCTHIYRLLPLLVYIYYVLYRLEVMFYILCLTKLTAVVYFLSVEDERDWPPCKVIFF